MFKENLKRLGDNVFWETEFWGLVKEFGLRMKHNSEALNFLLRMKYDAIDDFEGIIFLIAANTQCPAQCQCTIPKH